MVISSATAIVINDGIDGSAEENENGWLLNESGSFHDRVT